MLLNKLTSLLQIGKEKYEGVLKMVWEVLMDRRMHVGAYRQEIRGQLYAMLYRVLNLGKGVVKKLLDKCNEGEFVNNVITFVENEKDPRNMSLVFHIISIILNNYELGANKTVLFELLEAYYPIDFEGDEDQHVAIDK